MRPLPVIFLVLVVLMARTASVGAAESFIVRETFSISSFGKQVELKEGGGVEVVRFVGEDAFIKIQLPDGTETIVQVPASKLKRVESEKAPQVQSDDVASTKAGAEVTAESKSATESPGKLTLKEEDEGGKSWTGIPRCLIGDYLTLETESGKTELIKYKDLDRDSRYEVDKWKRSADHDLISQDTRIKPGAHIELIFTDLAPSRTHGQARIQVRIPEHYKEGQPAPFALLMGGGNGTDHYGKLTDFVDQKDYILAALPYPKEGPWPIVAINEGTSDTIVEYQQPMFEYLLQWLPETYPENRIVLGTSNGAHMIAVNSTSDWDEFTDFFSHYVLWEGGNSINRNFKELKRKKVCFGVGGKSQYREGNLYHGRTMENCGVEVDYIEAPEAGHGLDKEGVQLIRDWIAKNTQM
jgi:hypothetical protein